MTALLPPLTSGRRTWRLPLSHGAATAIGAALAGSYEPLAAVVALDPPLALWLAARAHFAGQDELRSAAALAAWGVTAGVFDGAFAVTGSTDADPANCWRLAVRSVVAARAVAAKGDAAYFLALVQAAPEWFAFADGAPAGRLPLAEALRRSLAALNRKGTFDWFELQSSVGLELRSYWLWPTVGPAELLSAIAGRLKSSAHLEAEKLAALAELAAGAGHEINNPLAVISGRAQLLARDEADPERRRELAAIHAQAHRVHEMIADLMLFARPPAAEPARIDVVKLVGRLVEDLRPAAAERGIDLLLSAPRSGLIVMADPTQLLVALRAVADNALYAMGSGGRLEITARRAASGWIEVELRDTGPGIPPEVRRHIFDPFYSGRSAGRGLGFGLSKCWRIVTNHGGQVRVESEPGQGACFTISLPAGKDVKKPTRRSKA